MMSGRTGMNDRRHLLTPEQWTRFLADLVHELRTPVASLRMVADLLAETPSGHRGAPQQRYSENVQTVVQEIQNLLGDVGELSRLLEGRRALRPEAVDLKQLVDQAEDAVRTQAWEAGIALTDSLDPALPRLLRTDPELLRKLLGLLLAASVSYAQSEVLLRLDIDEGAVRAVVSSDGHPFPEPVPPDLFAPFQPALRLNRQRAGPPLAPPPAASLARLLGGTLRGVNRGGRPAFELSLPAAP
jgi:signal transduction histidine kinase